MWIQALSHIIQATKSVELQKEHENYLRSQFQAADVTKDGYLLLDEFAGIVYIKLKNCILKAILQNYYFFVTELLKQFNIDMTADDIIDVFDEVNTDTTEINGQQVIDEKEFLDFYNSLLERDVLQIIFGQV